MMSSSFATSVSAEQHGSFRQRFWPLFLLGLLGIATLPLMLVPLLHSGALPGGMPDFPLPILVVLSLINPVLYLAGCTALGAWLTPKLGLVSLVTDRAQDGSSVWSRLSSAAPLAVAIGLALSVAIVFLDVVFTPYLSREWIAAATRMDASGGIGALVSGLFYGGITEEIMLRWGVLSFFAWAGWRLFQKSTGSPHYAVMWSAIFLSALLFGVGHLPAVAAVAPLDSMLVLRTVSLNALGGLFFGWLFWNRNLEAAMLSHATTHIGFVLLLWSGLA